MTIARQVEENSLYSFFGAVYIQLPVAKVAMATDSAMADSAMTDSAMTDSAMTVLYVQRQRFKSYR
ncbi:MAG: hypothetical protein AAFR58_08380 [Cyanobacteria bacterium J06627_28]